MPEVKTDTESTGGRSEKKSFVISLNPAVPTSPETLVAQKKVDSFKSLIQQGGSFDLDPKTIQELQSQGILPLDYQGGELQSALTLYSMGATSSGLVDAIKKADFLNEQEKHSLVNTSYLIEVLENAQVPEIPTTSEVFLANQEPKILIEQTPSPPPPQPNQVSFESQFGIIKQVFQEATGKAVDYAKQKAKDVAIKAIKEGGKKLLKEGSKIAAKEGVKLAVASAATAAVAGAAAAAEAAAGPPGWLLLAIEAIVFIIGKLLKRIIKFLKENLNKILERITGEKDTKKQLLWLSFVFSVIFLARGMLPHFLVFGAISSILAFLTGSSPFLMLLSPLTITLKLFITVFSLVISVLIIPLVTAIIVTPIVVALILFIINSGALIVPPHKAFVAGVVQSPYIEVVKTISIEEQGKCVGTPNTPNQKTCSNNDLPLTVKYSITVKALKGTLTKIRFENTCTVVKDGTIPPCTHPTPTPPQLISPTEDFTYEYELDYDENFEDSLVIDNFKVTADVESEQISATTSVGSASIQIGTPPTSCPSGWPVESGYITQGAYTSNSHAGQESIDIGIGVGNQVTARHTGIATVRKSDCLGNYVEITSVCGNRQFVSQYAHLDSVFINTGERVTIGQEIGLSGNTGNCTSGAHLHYGFKYVPSGVPKYPDNPPYMWCSFIPANIPRGCIRDECDCNDITSPECGEGWCGP